MVRRAFPLDGHSPVVASPSKRATGSRVCPKGRPKGALDAGGSAKTLMRRGRVGHGDRPADGGHARTRAAPPFCSPSLVCPPGPTFPARGRSAGMTSTRSGPAQALVRAPEVRRHGSETSSGYLGLRKPLEACRRRARRAEGVAGRRRRPRRPGNGSQSGRRVGQTSVPRLSTRRERCYWAAREAVSSPWSRAPIAPSPSAGRFCERRGRTGRGCRQPRTR